MGERSEYTGHLPLPRRGAGLMEWARIIDRCATCPATAMAAIDEVERQVRAIEDAPTERLVRGAA